MPLNLLSIFAAEEGIDLPCRYDSGKSSLRNAAGAITAGGESLIKLLWDAYERFMVTAVRE